MKISIVIPVYEAHGHYERFLDKLLTSIQDQTYKDYEIIMPDHSEDENIMNFIKKFDLSILHIFNSSKRGNIAANENLGLQYATGDIIKMMSMDNWISEPATFQLLVDNIGNYFWGGFRFKTYYEEKKEYGKIGYPCASSHMRMGCPDVVFFRRITPPILFDENVNMLSDKDFHYRLFRDYGEPIIIDTPCITIRDHPDQAQKTKKLKDKVKEEKEYLFNKHKIVLK